MAGFYIPNVLGTLLLPPGTFLLLLLAAWLSPWAWLKRTLLGITFFGLYLLSTAWCAGWLQKSLEIAPPLSLSVLPPADAIVVLGAGRHVDMPEYGSDTVNELTLERLRYAARLYKARHLPILVAGGMPGGGTQPEGTLMKAVLERRLRHSGDMDRNPLPHYLGECREFGAYPQTSGDQADLPGDSRK